jgi:hypothetical protein
MSFNASQWVKSYSQIKFDDSFIIQGITFELMSLSEDNIKKARELKTSQEIIELAANGGFAINRKRAIEDDSFTDSLSLLWEQDEVLAFTDPSIMFSVGEKVCELSGLTSFLDEILLDEEFAAEKEKDHELALLDYKLKESAYIIDGDNLNHAEIQAQADEYQNNQLTA